MRGLAPFWINPNDKNYTFPDVSLALLEPDGLLAVGGDLCPERIESAYKSGIFPWYNHDQPILWWSPEPRAVVILDNFVPSKSLCKTIRKKTFTVTFDTEFESVIEACSAPRGNDSGTWITTEMKQAYSKMHTLGHAHSVECWLNGKLVGGLYGIAFGKVFFGESMFSRVSNASKVAFTTLIKQLQHWQFTLIDCQVNSDHLTSLGAQSMPRQEFISLLNLHCQQPNLLGPWPTSGQGMLS